MSSIDINRLFICVHPWTEDKADIRAQGNIHDILFQHFVIAFGSSSKNKLREPYGSRSFPRSFGRFYFFLMHKNLSHS